MFTGQCSESTCSLMRLNVLGVAEELSDGELAELELFAGFLPQDAITKSEMHASISTRF
jgi:hypothetical protein